MSELSLSRPTKFEGIQNLSATQQRILDIQAACLEYQYECKLEELRKKVRKYKSENKEIRQVLLKQNQLFEEVQEKKGHKDEEIEVCLDDQQKVIDELTNELNEYKKMLLIEELSYESANANIVNAKKSSELQIDEE